MVGAGGGELGIVGKRVLTDVLRLGSKAAALGRYVAAVCERSRAYPAMSVGLHGRARCQYDCASCVLRAVVVWGSGEGKRLCGDGVVWRRAQACQRSDFFWSGLVWVC